MVADAAWQMTTANDGVVARYVLSVLGRRKGSDVAASTVPPPIGDRIRKERTRRGVTIRGLARDIGVSPSLISQIETDKSQPSVSTLYAISTALGISVEELFDARGVSDEQLADADRGPAAQPGRVGPVVRPEQRKMLTMESGVTWQRLGQVPGTHVEFMLTTYPPGSSSSGSDLLMRHPGTEYGYLVSGELTLTLGFDEYRLAPGDAVSFASTTPHSYRNDGNVLAVGVWFVIESWH